jgi:hypothetical protein
MGVAAALALAAMGCGKKDLTCPTGKTACNGACADLTVDATHCGACGTVCAFGEICQASACSSCASTCPSVRGCIAGACLPDLLVSCFSSDEVRPLALDLSASGPPRAVDAGPVSLAVSGARIWASHALPPPTLVGFGTAPTDALTRVTLGGGDLEVVRAAGGLLLVSDAGSHSLVVVSAATGAVLDEIPLARSAGNYENPHGIAVVGQRAYVALLGDAAEARAGFAFGQQVVVVDLPRGPCPTPPCSAVAKRILLEGLPGAYDAPGLPYPSGAVAVGSRVFVSLANLKLGGFGFFTAPAGNGRLLVIDTAAGDATSAVDLGPGCTNPGALAVAGSTVWVSCGGNSAVVPVDVSATTPVVGTAIPTGVVSGGIAVCAGRGYVTDQFSGKVARFDPAGVLAPVAQEICPLQGTFAWASDVTCAP